jgi:GrpB-like predicted nucleotidyltransferase (UPF0157 family)
VIRIELAEHDPRWALRYATHRARLLEALGESAATIEHIGSTAVPGIAAKPVVDMLVTGVDFFDARARSRLESAGYEVVVDEPGHRMYAPADRSAHVHFGADPREERHHVLFRDWLRDHPEDRVLYENVKRRLAAQPWSHTNEYAQAKSAVIQAIVRRAQEHVTRTDGRAGE